MNTELTPCELNFASSTHSSADSDAELHALIPSLSLAHVIQQRAAILERLNQAIALLREADQMAEAAHLGQPHTPTWSMS
jgi:hypothetical protein